MSSAIACPVRLVRLVALNEAIQASDASTRIDREKGIIYGVRVISHESRNGRHYLPEALRAAIPLYEGKSVRFDHPSKPFEHRSVTSLFGRLVNVREDAGGLRADLEFNREHPFAGFVCEMAERMSEQLGLSHNADGKIRQESDGKIAITEIKDVRSVDLVADAASVVGLFESQRSPMTIRQFLESLQLAPAAKGRVVKLLEDDGLMPSEGQVGPMDVPEGDWKADLVAAIGKLVGSESEDDHKMAQKIMAMLRPASATTAKTTEEDETDKDKEKDKDAVKESLVLAAKVKRLESTNASYALLLESQGIKAAPALVKAMAALDTDAERKTLLEGYKPVKSGTGPARTQTTGGGNGVTGPAPGSYEKGFSRFSGRQPASATK